MRTHCWVVVVLVAWVLWAKHEPLESPTLTKVWSREGAFETKQECNAAKVANENKWSADFVKHAHESLNPIFSIYSCWPADTDPRP